MMGRIGRHTIADTPQTLPLQTLAHPFVAGTPCARTLARSDSCAGCPRASPPPASRTALASARSLGGRPISRTRDLKLRHIRVTLYWSRCSSRLHPSRNTPPLFLRCPSRRTRQPRRNRPFSASTSVTDRFTGTAAPSAAVSRPVRPQPDPIPQSNPECPILGGPAAPNRLAEPDRLDLELIGVLPIRNRFPLAHRAPPSIKKLPAI